MEKDTIYVSPYFLFSLKLVIPLLMLLFAYMKNGLLFLIVFTLNYAVYFAENELIKARPLNPENVKKFSNFTYVLFFSSLSISYYFFFPQFAYSVAIPFFVFVLLWILNRAFSFYKFGRILVLYHLSVKVAFLAISVFTIITMLTGNPYFFLFAILLLICFISVIEEFLILRKMKRHDDDIESIFFKQ